MDWKFVRTPLMIFELLATLTVLFLGLIVWGMLEVGDWAIRGMRRTSDATLVASIQPLSADTAGLHEDGNTMTQSQQEAAGPPPEQPPEPVPQPQEPQGFATWQADLDENAAVRRVVFSTEEADKLYSVYLKHFFSPVQKAEREAKE